MWVRHTVRNVGPPQLGFPFPVGQRPFTVAYKDIISLHSPHLWIRHTVNYIILPQMWIHHTVTNVDLPHLGYPFLVGLSPSYRTFQDYS